MARGLPDDANTRGFGDVDKADNLGALAIRLGSSLGYDERPSILYLEAFAQGADSWTVERSSVGENATLTSESTLFGGVGLLLSPVDDSAEFVTAVKTLARFPEAVYGLFAMVGIAAATPDFRMQLVQYDGFYIRTYSLLVSASAQTLSYKSSDGSPVTIATGLSSMSAQGHFHSLGLLIDTEADTYVQAVFDSVGYDLSDIPTQAVLNGTAPRDVLSLYVKNDGSGEATVVVDSIGLVQKPIQL